MKYKIAAFFSGRNGFDALNKIILWPSVINMLLSNFIPVYWISFAVYILCAIGIGYSYFRAFSRNLTKRQAENDRYLAWRNRLKRKRQQRKTHCFFRCPKCRAHLRVPKGKGKISITCRDCGEKFIKTT